MANFQSVIGRIITDDIKYIAATQSPLIASDNDEKIRLSADVARRRDSPEYRRYGVTKAAATLWEVLTYPSRKLADLLGCGMHASERSGRETTLVVFVPRCMCAHISNSARRIRCWNAGPLVGATQCPRSPFPLLAAVSVAGAARIPELRAEIRFVRVPQRQPLCRSHRSHYLYGDP